MKASHHAAKLAARQKAFDDMKAEGAGNRPGAKKVRPSGFKTVMYHRPGSNKK